MTTPTKSLEELAQDAAFRITAPEYGSEISLNWKKGIILESLQQATTQARREERERLDKYLVHGSFCRAGLYGIPAGSYPCICGLDKLRKEK